METPFKKIAIEQGSSPVEQPALQMRSLRSVFRFSMISGRIEVLRRSICLLSRKKIAFANGDKSNQLFPLNFRNDTVSHLFSFPNLRAINMPSQNGNENLVILYKVIRGPERSETFRWTSFRAKEGRKMVARRYPGNLWLVTR